MKNILFITILFAAIPFESYKPNAVDILKKSFEKCQAVENGYYEMTMKHGQRNNIVSDDYNCYFKKLATDTIYSFAFKCKIFRKGEYTGDIIYTGNDFVSYSEKDSIGTIMSKVLWAEDIKYDSRKYTFYVPLTNGSDFINDKGFVDEKQVYQFIGIEDINGFSCYHIKLNVNPENDGTEFSKRLRTEINYWINKQDYIPVQYSYDYDILRNKDTMYYSLKYILTKYELNNLKDKAKLELSSIPSYIKLKDYKPQPLKKPELLTNNTIAPNWSLISLNDKTVNLSDFKGKLVLIDFFYKKCTPCRLALPILQSLHEKYYDKGLRIIGIDPYGAEIKDDYKNFLSKQGINYTVLLGGMDVANDYNVIGYPTIYLINKDGKIIFSEVGYEEGTKDKLEKIIIENL